MCLLAWTKSTFRCRFLHCSCALEHCFQPMAGVNFSHQIQSGDRPLMIIMPAHQCYCRGVEIIYGDPRRESDGFGGPWLQSDIGLWVHYLISVVFWLYPSFIGEDHSSKKSIPSDHIVKFLARAKQLDTTRLNAGRTLWGAGNLTLVPQGNFSCRIQCFYFY